MRARVCPRLGGSVVDWLRGDAPVFRPLPDGALAAHNARQLACFPLLPYSNRIADGRFEWHGEHYQLDHNFPQHPHTIHGVGWQQPWTVLEQTEAQLRLELIYDPQDAGLYTWPFKLRAEQTITLLPDGMRIALSVTNRASFAWPAGLGLHPHFPRDPGLSLGFHADAVWTRDENSLPIAPEPVPPAWCFDPPRAPDGPMLDNCFSGWDGRAAIDLPGHGHRVTIEAEPLFRHLVVYTPDAQPFCAVEPVSHLPDAINRAGEHGLHLLPPGETLRGSVRFAVTML